jgi:Flp pilus assembly protein CpaB
MPVQSPNRLKSQRTVILIVGVLIATVGVVGTLLLGRGQGTGGTAPGNQVTVVVAAKDLPQGHQLSAGDLQQTQVAANAVPDQAFTDLHTPIGQFLAVGVHRQQILSATLMLQTTAPVPRTQAPITLPDGDVAIAIPDSAMQGAGGYIQPGDHIDILVDLNGAGTLQYVLQDVPVLRVGSSGSTAGGAPDLLLIQLPRRQAEEIGVLLEGKGNATIVRYVLRPVDQNGKGYLNSGPDAPYAPSPAPSDSPISPSFFNSLFSTPSG